MCFLQWVGQQKLGPKLDSDKTKSQKVLNTVFWLLGLSRNALIVFITGSISYLIYNEDKYYFAVIGDIPKGMPPVSWPPFEVPEIRDETSGEILQEYESFWDMVNYIGAGLVVVPLVGLLENMNTCKTFCEYHLLKID